MLWLSSHPLAASLLGTSPLIRCDFLSSVSSEWLPCGRSRVDLHLFPHRRFLMWELVTGAFAVCLLVSLVFSLLRQISPVFPAAVYQQYIASSVTVLIAHVCTSYQHLSVHTFRSDSSVDVTGWEATLTLSAFSRR